MALSNVSPKQWYKVLESDFIIRLIELEILYLKMQALTIWILPKKLGVANRTASQDLL